MTFAASRSFNRRQSSIAIFLVVLITSQLPFHISSHLFQTSRFKTLLRYRATTMNDTTHASTEPKNATVRNEVASPEPKRLLEDGDMNENNELIALGYEAQLNRNRSMFTLLFQSLSMMAIPYGEGGPMITTIYGGGQLSIFVGWVISVLFNQCVAVSLAELASAYPTSAGPYYWSFQIADRGKTALSFITGWIWLIGNWTIILSVNFGFASMIAGTVEMYHPDWAFTDWQIVLVFYGVTTATFCKFSLDTHKLCSRSRSGNADFHSNGSHLHLFQPPSSHA